MKLNKGKCTFGVQEGLFLGYQITKEGIWPKQTKIQEFIDSKTPHTLISVQEINGRLMALGRFNTKSVDKALHSFKS